MPLALALPLGTNAHVAKRNPPSVQKPTRIPYRLWLQIKDAMAYEGIRAFSQFNLSALTHHVRTINERRKASEPRQE